MPSLRFDDAWQTSADGHYKCRLCTKEFPNWVTHSKALAHDDSELHTIRARELDRPPPLSINPTRRETSSLPSASAYQPPAGASTSDRSNFPDFQVDPYVAIPGPRCASDPVDQIYDDYNGTWAGSSGCEQPPEDGVVEHGERDAVQVSDEVHARRNTVIDPPSLDGPAGAVPFEDASNDFSRGVFPNFAGRAAAEEHAVPCKPRFDVDDAELYFREVASHFVANPLLSYAGRYILMRIESYLRVQGGEINLAEYATSEAAQAAVGSYLRDQIRNSKSSYRKRTFRSVGGVANVPAISLPEYTIQTIDALHVGDREAAKYCEVVQGQFAYTRIVAHRLILDPAPQAANGDTAFWRIICRDLKQNEEQWGPDRNSPSWRAWSREYILQDMTLWPAPLHLHGYLAATFSDLDVAPPTGGTPIQPVDTLALPPPAAAQGLFVEDATAAEHDGEVA
ncbi:unnamed protein product [Peniophora sp. CBMAI 1063]|nr:unnamed protein product [Peniophora sp. CBMAI 1063]